MSIMQKLFKQKHFGSCLLLNQHAAPSSVSELPSEMSCLETYKTIKNKYSLKFRKKSGVLRNVYGFGFGDQEPRVIMLSPCTKHAVFVKHVEAQIQLMLINYKTGEIPGDFTRGINGEIRFNSAKNCIYIKPINSIGTTQRNWICISKKGIQKAPDFFEYDVTIKLDPKTSETLSLAAISSDTQTQSENNPTVNSPRRGRPPKSEFVPEPEPAPEPAPVVEPKQDMSTPFDIIIRVQEVITKQNEVRHNIFMDDMPIFTNVSDKIISRYINNSVFVVSGFPENSKQRQTKVYLPNKNRIEAHYYCGNAEVKRVQLLGGPNCIKVELSDGRHHPLESRTLGQFGRGTYIIQNENSR